MVTAKPTELSGEFKAVDTTQQPTATPSVIARFGVPNGTPSIQQI